jgi:hypothetical protein
MTAPIPFASVDVVPCDWSSMKTSPGSFAGSRSKRNTKSAASAGSVAGTLIAAAAFWAFALPCTRARATRPLVAPV